MRIIGITGTLGAGKGAVVEYLKSHYGFVHYSARDLIAEEVERRGMPVNRDTLIAVGNMIREEHGPGHIAEELAIRAKAAGTNAVIESLRTPGEVEAASRHGHFMLFAVDADPRIRYDRIRKRKTATDEVTFEEFMEHERQEMNSSDPNKQNLAACIRRADHVLMNNATLERLHGQVDLIMKEAGIFPKGIVR
jgi:dephospho-CoA kinase